MKNALLLSFGLLLTGCTTQKPVLDDFGERINIVITESTTRDELNGFSDKLRKQNINFTINETRYSDKGKLMRVGGTITTECCGKGSFAGKPPIKIMIDRKEGAKQPLLIKVGD